MWERQLPAGLGEPGSGIVIDIGRGRFTGFERMLLNTRTCAHRTLMWLNTLELKTPGSVHRVDVFINYPSD